jgi:vancomycin resistance protein YoaR
MKVRAQIVFMAAALLSTAAFAQTSNEVPAEQDSLQVLVQQQTAIKADMEDGGIQGLSPRQNGLLRKQQVEFFAIAEGKSRLDDLSIDEKIRMENALEKINAIVGNTPAATAKQNVCWREAKTGSTVKVTRCGTEAERDRAREGARDYLLRPKICGENCGS